MRSSLCGIFGLAGRGLVSIVREEAREMDGLALWHVDTFVRDHGLTACSMCLGRNISALPNSLS